ncbi:MAG TPA: PD-(D/E)XK nuclease family protein, partial [Candidatus Paceibacterota bacterium]|nr:PD-(D/E)XK nuclease family protein [Candidatus Paceibacterota bacterium]
TASRKKARDFEPIEVLKLEADISPDSKTELREAFLRRSFSVTALNNFLECPWKYFFRNLLLIPEPYEWSAMLGTACHNCLERFHREAARGRVLSKSELKKLVAQCVEKQPFSSRDLPLALEKAEENIFAYASSFNLEKDNKMFVEESVEFPVQVPHKKGNFEILLTGKIDLAVKSKAGLELMDFKTKKKMTRNEIMGETKNSDGGYMRQLQFYKLLWENARQGENVDMASLVFLTPERGKIHKESFELGESDKIRIEEMTLKVLREIYDFEFLKSGCALKDCDYCRMAASFKA